MEDLSEKKIDLRNFVFADLHIHSRFSRACSKDLTIDNLVKWARVKGIGLLGTGDFTHEKWLFEIKEKLVEENGIFFYKDARGKFPFILTSEISLVYTDDGKGRRVHLVYLAPNLSVVGKINSWLDGIGRRDYDGRPIFKISCRDFVAKMMEIDERIEVIPAHIWTSWFGVFGSKGGYDCLNDAFKDMRKNIHAIETGISSNPAMNWRIKDLENISILSFSDSHSFWPWRLGREVTIFRRVSDEEITYEEIINQIRENSFIGTIETDPAYGMYHYDGHRVCDFSCNFKETSRLNGICPKCKKPLTIGVEYRIEELANLDSNHLHKKIFYSILPLHEIISLGLGIGMNSKACWKFYNELLDKFDNEFNILLNVSEQKLLGVLKNKLLTDLILKNRVGQIKVKPGYDGTYGVALLESDKEKVEKQKKLF